MNNDLAWLRRFRKVVASRTDALCDVVQEESGKPRFETLTAEIIPVLDACKWCERSIPKFLKPRKVRGGRLFQIGQRHRVVRLPVGDVAIIATWNYPIQLLGIQLLQALVCGNRVWVKPSERSPRSQRLLLEIAEEASPGPDRLHAVDATREAGTALLRDRRFDHVVFTGSTEVGRSIAASLAPSLTPSTLELSGSDSAIVLADADCSLAARSIAYAVCLNGGQTCMAPKRVLVAKSIREPFIEGLKRELQAMHDESSDATQTHESERARVRRAASESMEQGDRVIVESDQAIVLEAKNEKSAFFRGDHFGPGLSVLAVDDLEHAVRLHRGIPKHLATAVFTRSTRDAQNAAGLLQSGIVTINDCILPTGHPGLSIGGRGQSGWGASRGLAGLEAMTRRVFVASTHPKIRVPTSPPSERVQQGLARWVKRLYG